MAQVAGVRLRMRGRVGRFFAFAVVVAVAVVAPWSSPAGLISAGIVIGLSVRCWRRGMRCEDCWCWCWCSRSGQVCEGG